MPNSLYYIHTLSLIHMFNYCYVHIICIKTRRYGYHIYYTLFVNVKTTRIQFVSIIGRLIYDVAPFLKQSSRNILNSDIPLCLCHF